ncbi:hypothetical protein SUGI_0787440 [Cryptomeria japonica]|nr:hypothetical protein SUGI_0787440 [Cryptomeria japonica]
MFSRMSRVRDSPRSPRKQEAGSSAGGVAVEARCNGGGGRTEGGEEVVKEGKKKRGKEVEGGDKEDRMDEPGRMEEEEGGRETREKKIKEKGENKSKMMRGMKNMRAEVGSEAGG